METNSGFQISAENYHNVPSCSQALLGTAEELNETLVTMHKILFNAEESLQSGV